MGRSISKFLPVLTLAFAVLVSAPLRAQLHIQRPQITELTLENFKSLAVELAPKVKLFRDTWEQDPKAEFFGGTTRDYLYWLKGEFRGITKSAEIARKVEELRARLDIDVREFIVGDSDVDVLSERLYLNEGRYGVRKIDKADPSRFDSKTTLGKNELKQGFIPVEKIRMGAGGFVDQPEFGNGIEELFTGKITVHFADEKEFKKTYYAKQKLNHEILLAIRFVRLLGVNYYHTYGDGYPKLKELLRIDPESEKAVQTVIDKTMSNAGLLDYLKESQFTRWLNATIDKSFRSYTNPTAALELFKHFKLDRLISRYDHIHTIYQYVFAQPRDEHQIEEHLKTYAVDPTKFFLDPQSVFPNGELYHGTRTDQAYWSILFQGVLPSENGTGGAVGSSRVDLQACKLEYSIVSPK